MLVSIFNHKYLIVSIILGLFAFGYYLSFVPGDITWRNVSYDSPNFLIAAKYLRLSHPSPGSALYNLFNAGWIRVIPFGTDYFKIVLISVLASSAVTSILYYHTRSFIAPLLWLGSTVVLSQSTVLEQYTLVALFCLVSFILYEKDHRNWAYIVLSFGVMINHLCGFLALVFLANDYFQKRSLKPFLCMFISTPLLLYIPLVNREPYIFINGNNVRDYWNYLFSQGGLLGGLSVLPYEPLLQRLGEFSILFFGSVGAVFLYVKKVWKDKYARLALIGASVFSVYYVTNLNPQTYTYLVPATVLAALAFGKVRSIKFKVAWYALFTSFIISSLFLFSPDHSAAKDFYEDLDTIPANSIVWSHNRGWEKTTMELYNYNNNTHIDQLTLRKPVRTNYEIMLTLREAEAQNRLYKTVVVNKPSYHVILQPASAQSVLYEYITFDVPK